jgi:hypothetical protein
MTVWWSDQAASRRWANSSTGWTRLRSQTRNPTSAAARPLAIQTRFFMPAPLFLDCRCERVVGGWMQERRNGLASGAERGAGRDSRLEGMDRVRFGRALGYGARHAAKAVMQAADAATAPSGKAAAPTAKGASAREPGARAAAAPVVERVVRARPTVAETKKHAGRLGRSVWTPVARFSSVVWMQVTGLFFGLLATFLGEGAWKERAAWRLPVGSHAAQKFWVLVAAFALFAYFCVSNFVRARLRERR